MRPNRASTTTSTTTGETITEPEITPLPQGDYVLEYPEQVELDTPFDVATDSVVGGPVTVTLESGPCRSIMAITPLRAPVDTYFGTETGTCVFRASQVGDDEYLPAPDHVVEVRVTLQWKFSVELPRQVAVDDPFSIDVKSPDDAPPVDVRVDGPCFFVEGEPHDTGFFEVYVAGDNGVCIFTFYRDGTELYRAVEEVRKVEVVEPVVEVVEPVVV